MKILMLLDHEFPPDIRVENEIEALTEAGHSVHVACYTRKKRALLDSHLGAVIHRKPISSIIYKSSVGVLKFPFYFHFWKKFLDKICAEEHYDAFHVHDLPLARIGYKFANKNNAKFILDLHENWPALLRVATHTQTFLGKLLSTDKQWRKYELEYCRKAYNVIVVVDEAKKRLADLGISPNKITIVSNTLNRKHFEVPETTPDPAYFTLLYAGGINKHRGLQYIIMGLKFVKNSPKPVRLWILGEGSYLNELNQLVKKEGIEEMVDFKGWKKYDEMQHFFGKADACLIPHIKNDHTDSTIPHKLFQYMYAGKPTISSNCEPLARIIQETDSGLIYRFDNPKDFADKLKLLIENETLLKKIIANGKRSVAENYLWELDKNRLLSIYS